MLGIDILSICDGIKAGELLIEHIRAVRQLKGLEHAEAIVAIESNYFGWAPQIIRHLSQSVIAGVKFTRNDAVPGTNGEELRPGSRTFASSKLLGVDYLNAVLESGTLRVHKDFIAVYAERSLYPSNFHEFIRQLKSFARIAKVDPNAVTKRTPVEWSGKYSGKDDMVMTMLIGLVEMYNYITQIGHL